MAATTIQQALPARVNLNAYRGDSWQQTFRFLLDTVPLDLTDLQVEARVRGTDGTEADLVVSVINPAAGEVQLRLPPGGVLEPDLYDYDIEVVGAGTVTTWVRGKLRLERDVTNEQP